MNQNSGNFEPEKFEDHYETALVDLINKKRNGQPITPKERPRAGNVVDLMEALRRSVGQGSRAGEGWHAAHCGPGQKEMLMPIEGKKQVKETAAKKPAPGGTAEISVVLLSRVLTSRLRPRSGPDLEASERDV